MSSNMAFWQNFPFPEVEKIQVFVITQGDLRGLGPCLYIICTLVRPNYPPNISLEALSLDLLYSKT